MPFCPFKKKECFTECPYFAHGVKKCGLTAQTMIFEDLHKLSLVLLDNAVLKEEDQGKGRSPGDKS
ncbi:MAG: hypothetical protein RDV48_13305 [Candidatus Eremiobacteraeota bacterium]|nr:hypothetical protein [Candidatus Eremiobacteraeota bacterium]